jgi:hypothetical protein
VLTATSKEQQPEFCEKHYTLAELALHWHMSVRTVREWFLEEPGVIKFGINKLTKTRKRTYISLRIPESVAWKVYHRMSGKHLHQPGNRPEPAA